MNANRSRNYASYLLRLWREDENPSWRVSLEDPQTEDKLYFSGLDEFFSYLEQLTDREDHRVE